MLRADPRIVQAGGYRIHRSYLAVLVLAEVGLHPVEYAQPPGVYRGCGLECVYALAGGLASYQLHLLVPYEIVESADGVAAASDACHQHVRELSLLLHHLGPYLFADDGLEISHYSGKRMGTHHRAQAVMRIVDAGGPLAHAFRYGVLQGARAGLDPADLGAQEPHAVHVEGLPPHVLDAHIDDAFHAHEGCRSRRCHAVLAGAGLGYETGLPHLLRQKGLAEDIVDLMRAGVV